MTRSTSWYTHLGEHHSGCHLMQALKKNHFARQYVASEEGIQKSSFFEDISSREMEQMAELFGKLYMRAAMQLPIYASTLKWCGT